MKTASTARAIIVPPGAPDTARTAAQELRAGLVRAGAAPAPRIDDAADAGTPAFVVGVPPPGETAALTEPDACRIASGGDRCYLWGQGPRGPLNSVYAYLQDVLGFRWLTDDHEVVPRLDDPAGLPADLAVEQRPSFAIRDVGYQEALRAPWSARLRLNGEFAAGRRGPEWGGGMRYTHFVHTFYTLVPPERYFASHPEYFALVDGRRREAFAQLCLSNPAIVAIAADAVRGWFAANPEARIASVSQNDWVGACECPGCRALLDREGSQAGPVLHFVNAVAREVARDFPDRLIDTLAYWYTEDPPRHVRPEPNVAVRLCHMSPSCEAHAVQACPRNAPFAGRLEAWSRIAPRLHIWDYHTNFAHFLLPFPNFAAISSDLALFRRRGVESVFCQGDLAEGGGGEWSTLRAYYLARLLWDASLEPEALVDEFLRGVFPHSHGPVRAYFDLIQARARDPELHLRMFSPPQSGHLPAEVVAAAGASLAEARSQAAARGDARERADVERLQLCVDYTRLAMPPEFVATGEQIRPRVPEDAGGGVLAPSARPRALDRFEEGLGRHGIRSVREARPLHLFRRRVEALSGAHAAPIWTSGDWTLRLVPDLGGRIWEASFAGRPLLVAAAMEDADYPASRGYEESCAGDLGRTEPFVLERAADGALALTATIEGMAGWHDYRAIAVRREVGPAGSGALRVRTTVVNQDTAAHPLCIRPRHFLRAPVADAAWRDPDGAWVPVDPGTNGQAHRLGATGWRVRTGEVHLRCVHAAVDRVDVQDHGWGWRIACDAGQRLVPPGGSLTLEQVWSAEL